jgi:hypothetical protein
MIKESTKGARSILLCGVTILALAGEISALNAQDFRPTVPVPFKDSPRANQRPVFGPVGGAKKHGGGVRIRQSFDGIDYSGSNCGCLPPDT